MSHFQAQVVKVIRQYLRICSQPHKSQIFPSQEIFFANLSIWKVVPKRTQRKQGRYTSLKEQKLIDPAYLPTVLPVLCGWGFMDFL